MTIFRPRDSAPFRACSLVRIHFIVMPVNRRLPHLLAVAAVCFAVVSCAGNSRPDAPLPPSTSVAVRGVDARIHAYVNASRASSGKRPLERDAYLDSLALEHARESMDRSIGRGPVLGHAGFQNRFVRANQRIGANIFAENIHCIPAGVSDPARRFTEDWKASRVHRDNLFGPWTRTGIGVVDDPSGRIWSAQVFASVP